MNKFELATEPGAGCAHFGRRGKGRAAAHCSLVAWSLCGSKDQVHIKTTNVFFCLIKASALAAKRWAEYLPRASQATESWSSRRERWDWKTFLTDCQPGPAGRSPAWQVMSMASWWQWTHVPSSGKRMHPHWTALPPCVIEVVLTASVVAIESVKAPEELR